TVGFATGPVLAAGQRRDDLFPATARIRSHCATGGFKTHDSRQAACGGAAARDGTCARDGPNRAASPADRIRRTERVPQSPWSSRRAHLSAMRRAVLQELREDHSAVV